MKFKTIKRDNIFCDDFLDFKENNWLNFGNKKMAVLYAPNGTGKTSFASVLSQENRCEYTLEIDNTLYTNESDKLFHIIEDQNGRNIISGSTEDFILGDNIKREYFLKGIIEKEFETLFTKLFSKELKDTFGISTKNTAFSEFISNKRLVYYISDIANNKSKGKEIDKSKFIEDMIELESIPIPEYDESKFKFLIKDFSGKEKLIKTIMDLEITALLPENNFYKMEESEDAIKILEKYYKNSECIVCDHDINSEDLLEIKKSRKEEIYTTLSPTAKTVVDKILEIIPMEDPFNLKILLKKSLVSGKADDILMFVEEIKKMFDIYDCLINNLFFNNINDSKIVEYYTEYSSIILEKPEFDNEDIIFIESFMNESMNRKIELKRDEENNLRLLLDNQEFLNHDRKSLGLSNGEQNFLSLAFELMKAKKTSYKYIVLDDPISSFDSIYKNKITYAIVKILSDKKSIILSHNTDLIKLLEHQQPNSFELYFLNNTHGESNGFININNDEKRILIYVHEFINVLRTSIGNEIINEKEFIISLLPFMRGYSMITGNIAYKNIITKLMHGYEDETVDITKIYNDLFECEIIKTQHLISAKDIINIDIDDMDILRTTTYPLLNKTLRHTLTYLYLRLNVEDVLVRRYNINTKKYDMLTSIINKAFPPNKTDDLSKRVFFLSKKTLLNEFNHFEMDMNIFQPAIDITNSALRREKEDIMDMLLAI